MTREHVCLYRAVCQSRYFILKIKLLLFWKFWRSSQVTSHPAWHRSLTAPAALISTNLSLSTSIFLYLWPPYESCTCCLLSSSPSLPAFKIVFSQWPNNVNVTLGTSEKIKNKTKNKNRSVQMVPRSYLCPLSCQQLPCLFKTLLPTQSSLIWFPGRVCLIFLFGILALPASSEQPGWLANNSSSHTHHRYCVFFFACINASAQHVLNNLPASGWRAAPSVYFI